MKYTLVKVQPKLEKGQVVKDKDNKVVYEPVKRIRVNAPGGKHVVLEHGKELDFQTPAEFAPYREALSRLEKNGDVKCVRRGFPSPDGKKQKPQDGKAAADKKDVEDKKAKAAAAKEAKEAADKAKADADKKAKEAAAAEDKKVNEAKKADLARLEAKIKETKAQLKEVKEEGPKKALETQLKKLEDELKAAKK